MCWVNTMLKAAGNFAYVLYCVEKGSEYWVSLISRPDEEEMHVCVCGATGTCEGGEGRLGSAGPCV